MPVKQATDPRSEARMPGGVVFVGMIAVVTDACDVDQAEGTHVRISVGAR